MNGILVLVLSIYVPQIYTENICLNPGEDNLKSVFVGDDLTLLCPVNYPTGPIKWSFGGEPDTILSNGMKLNSATFRFNVSFANDLKQFIYIRIYNISINEQHLYKCYYTVKNGTFVEYNYTVKLSNIPNVLIKEENGTNCCAVNGTNINATSITWKQRYFSDTHNRSVHFDKIKSSEMLKSSQPMFCLNNSELVTYIRKERYICMAHISINGRKQPISRTTSIEKHNIKDRPLCIQDKRIQHNILGSNVSIVTNFYSKSEFYNISFRIGDGEIKLNNKFSVSSTNITLVIFNVTLIVNEYEIIINMTEFSDEDIGDYTIKMYNKFGYGMCLVQLQPHGHEGNSGMVETESTMKRAKETKYLQWYMMACGSLIVVFVAMYALRSTFLKTVNACSNTTIWKPRFHKSTAKQATRKQRRAYSDQFMEVTLNQLNNGERILIIGQTNEMDASTETNI